MAWVREAEAIAMGSPLAGPSASSDVWDYHAARLDFQVERREFTSSFTSPCVKRILSR